MKSLWDYAADGGWRYVENLLSEHSAYAHERDSNGRTLLHHVAITSADAENTAYLLIQFGADINAKDHNGNAPIHLASFYGMAWAIEFLLAHDVNIYLKNNSDLNPIEFMHEYASAQNRELTMWGVEERFWDAVSRFETSRVDRLVRFLPVLLVARDVEGHTAFDIALQHSSEAMRQVILLEFCRQNTVEKLREALEASRQAHQFIDEWKLLVFIVGELAAGGKQLKVFSFLINRFENCTMRDWRDRNILHIYFDRMKDLELSSNIPLYQRIDIWARSTETLNEILSLAQTRLSYLEVNSIYLPSLLPNWVLGVKEQEEGSYNYIGDDGTRVPTWHDYLNGKDKDGRTPADIVYTLEAYGWLSPCMIAHGAEVNYEL